MHDTLGHALVKRGSEIMLTWSLREAKTLIGMKSLLLEEALNTSKTLRLITEYIGINLNRIMAASSGK